MLSEKWGVSILRQLIADGREALGAGTWRRGGIW